MSPTSNPVVGGANQVDAGATPTAISRGQLMDRVLLCSNRGFPDLMSTLRFRIARIALALGVAAAVWACNAPFIPIPPPGQTATFTSELISDGDGGQKTVWLAHGPANKYAALAAGPGALHARFFVFDTTRMVGVIAEAFDDGSFTSPPMDGTEGDTVAISYETAAGAHSMDVCFQLTTTTVMLPKNKNVPSAPEVPCP